MKTLTGILLATSFISCTNSEKDIAALVESKVHARMAEMEAVEQSNMAVIKEILECFGSGKTDRLDVLIHEDFQNHNAPEGLRDKAGFYKIVETVHGAFSSFDELDLKPVQLFAKGDMVAMMDLGTGRRSGKMYQHKDIHIFKMKNGKMFEHWNSFGLPTQRDILMKFLEETNPKK